MAEASCVERAPSGWCSRSCQPNLQGSWDVGDLVLCYGIPQGKGPAPRSLPTVPSCTYAQTSAKLGPEHPALHAAGAVSDVVLEPIPLPPLPPMQCAALRLVRSRPLRSTAMPSPTPPHPCPGATPGSFRLSFLPCRRCLWGWLAIAARHSSPRPHPRRCSTCAAWRCWEAS